MADDVHPAASEVAPRPPRGDTRGPVIAAVLALALLTGIWTWWSLKFGAFYGTVLLPGAALLAVVVAILAGAAPWKASLSLSGPVRLALWSLTALAAWSVSSALWSPTPDIAVGDAQRIIAYVLAFGLGIWACTLLGRRMELSLLPLAIAAAIAGGVTLVRLLTGDDPSLLLDEDGTLQYPLGYRNATAAFFLIALWPAIGLASSTRMPRTLRVGGFLTATLCVEIGLVAQSRGSILGAAAGLLFYLLASGRRVHAFAWLLLALLPTWPCFFAGSDLFEAAGGGEGLAGALDEMHSAGLAMLMGLAVALPLSFVGLKLEPLLRPRKWATPKRMRGALAFGALAFVVGTVAVVGNPVTWAGDRVDEFLAGEPDLSQESSRFTLNAGSNRSEVWRVAIAAAGDDPLFGEGAGGFHFRYNREREDVNQLALDAHSVWLEMLSELGAVGLGLFGAAIVGAFWGVIRARRLGPAAAQLSAAALAAGAYWLAHASVDWFWPYPAVTAPALALLGAAAAPSLLVPGRGRPPRAKRLALAGAALLFACTTFPPYFSERLVERAYDSFRADSEQAYDDLALARDLNPLTDAPALAEGLIAKALGDRERAIESFREATRKRPEEYASHFFLASLYATKDPALARTELAVVTELNPLSPRIESLEAKIAAAERRSTANR